MVTAEDDATALCGFLQQQMLLDHPSMIVSENISTPERERTCHFCSVSTQEERIAHVLHSMLCRSADDGGCRCAAQLEAMIQLHQLKS